VVKEGRYPQGKGEIDRNLAQHTQRRGGKRKLIQNIFEEAGVPTEKEEGKKSQKGPAAKGRDQGKIQRGSSF